MMNHEVANEYVETEESARCPEYIVHFPDYVVDFDNLMVRKGRSDDTTRHDHHAHKDLQKSDHDGGSGFHAHRFASKGAPVIRNQSVQAHGNQKEQIHKVANIIRLVEDIFVVDNSERHDAENFAECEHQF